MTMIKFEIKNRWSGNVQFMAEIDCEESKSYSFKLGLAVKDAISVAANLTDANLTRANLTGADLTRADLTGADLTAANLTGADLTGADLTGANLTDADLTRADLTGAKKAYVEPVPDLDKRILKAIESGGHLKMDAWHKCETTHCRAGWAITLHPAGKTLESIYGSSAAGALIYAAAYPKMPVPDFHASNETAMADIQARAKL